MLFKDLLKEKMDERKLTIKDVSKLSEVKQTNVGMYLTGAIPKEKDQEKLCVTLNIDPDDITYDEWSISVTEASKLLTKGPEFVKENIRAGRIKGLYTTTSNGTGNFHIPRIAFMKYMNGDDGGNRELLEIMYKQMELTQKVIEENTKLRALLDYRQNKNCRSSTTTEANDNYTTT